MRWMNQPGFLATIFTLLSLLPVSADDLPPTLLTRRGTLIVDQQFEKSLPPFDGKSNGFASGFHGWRYNAAARGGHWEVKDGSFTGTENPDPSIKHPATASYGFDFKDAVIQCEVRMNDVPMAGRSSRSISVRTTDTRDYVCSVRLNPNGWGIEKSDNDHGGPDKAVSLGELKTPVKLNEWHSVLFEILGDTMTVTVDGRTLSGTHPLIGTEKHSIMFVSGVESSVRKFRVWEARPNPDWEKNRRTIATGETRKGS